MLKNITREDSVAQFTKATDGPIDSPFSIKGLLHRYDLIREETNELMVEILQAISELEFEGNVTDDTKVKLLKEMADVQYVLSGMSVQFKDLTPFLPAFNRVHKSNMTKVDPVTGKINKRKSDGKVIKSSWYKEPDLYPLLRSEEEVIDRLHKYQKETYRNE